jgi:hypothetical protein
MVRARSCPFFARLRGQWSCTGHGVAEQYRTLNISQQSRPKVDGGATHEVPPSNLVSSAGAFRDVDDKINPAISDPCDHSIWWQLVNTLVSWFVEAANRYSEL